MSVKYTIEGGEAGKRRLDVLAKVHGPHTVALLDRVGVAEGARCLDLGCGGGHVSRELARRVGRQGSVVAMDLDANLIELARADTARAGITNIEFRCGDATQLEESPYDVAFARFLSRTLGIPPGRRAAMAAALEPGGVVVVEDTDFTGCFCHPPCRAFDRYVELYRETVRRRGGNADLGPMLPSLLHGAGLKHVDVPAHQSCGLNGEAKLLAPLTLERIADSVVGEGVAGAEEGASLL